MKKINKIFLITITILIILLFIILFSTLIINDKIILLKIQNLEHLTFLGIFITYLFYLISGEIIEKHTIQSHDENHCC